MIRALGAQDGRVLMSLLTTLCATLIATSAPMMMSISLCVGNQKGVQTRGVRITECVRAVGPTRRRNLAD